MYKLCPLVTIKTWYSYFRRHFVLSFASRAHWESGAKPAIDVSPRCTSHSVSVADQLKYEFNIKALCYDKYFGVFCHRLRTNLSLWYIAWMSIRYAPLRSPSLYIFIHMNNLMVNLCHSQTEVVGTSTGKSTSDISTTQTESYSFRRISWRRVSNRNGYEILKKCKE